MSLINRTFAFGIAVTVAAGLVSAAFAQTADATSAVAPGDIQRTADLVNLMRTVLDPNPAPVLAFPEERAVSGKTASSPVASIATTVPVVIMPDIETPEEKTREPGKVGTRTQEPAQPAVVVSTSKRNAGEDDSDQYPPFYYVFFFGEYVPYFDGWYYYSDRWLWGRRWPVPPEPPGWIPPPPPPRPRLLEPVRPKEPDNTIPVVPSRHRIPRKNEMGGESLSPNTTIPVAPSQHRFPSKAANQIDFPERNTAIPVAPSQHRITGNAARQNPAPEQNSSIPVSPGAHRIPRGNR